MVDVSMPIETTPARVTRRRLLIAFGVALVLFVVLAGIPQDRTEVVIGCLILAGILTFDDEGGISWGAMRDLTLIAGLFFLYDRGRGAADSLFHAHTTLPIDIDKAIGFGHVPTLWLQHHLLLGHAQWWEPLPSFVYMSHFIVPLVVCVLVRVKARHLWRRWLNRFFAVSTIVLVFYVLVPWTPPWLDAQEGHLAPVRRSVSRGLAEAGLNGAGKLVHEGAAYSNQVAAMPSLHTAFPTLYLLFFWPLAKRTWQRVLLAIYPLAMGFSLVLTGEHWVSDVLAAYVLVALVHVGFNRWERRASAAA